MKTITKTVLALTALMMLTFGISSAKTIGGCCDGPLVATVRPAATPTKIRAGRSTGSRGILSRPRSLYRLTSLLNSVPQYGLILKPWKDSRRPNSPTKAG